MQRRAKLVYAAVRRGPYPVLRALSLVRCRRQDVCSAIADRSDPETARAVPPKLGCGRDSAAQSLGVGDSEC